MYKIHYIIPILFILIFACNAKNSKESNTILEKDKCVLLIGVTHFHLFGKSGLKNFEILTEENQNILDEIAYSVKEFNPSKIYVEWNESEQKKLDLLYTRYLNDKGIDNLGFMKSEFYQVAFRLGKLANLKEISAIDRGTSLFPIDSILLTLDSLSKIELMDEITNYQENITHKINEKIEGGDNILKILEHINSDESKNNDLKATHSLLKYGDEDNNICVDVLSNWHKKHLGIWSKIQKEMKTVKNQKIVIIYGMSHTAILEKIIEMNSDEWRILDLKSVMKKNKAANK